MIKVRSGNGGEVAHLSIKETFDNIFYGRWIDRIIKNIYFHSQQSNYDKITLEIEDLNVMREYMEELEQIYFPTYKRAEKVIDYAQLCNELSNKKLKGPTFRHVMGSLIEN